MTKKQFYINSIVCMVRIVLTIFLLNTSIKETGWATTALLILIYIKNEIDYYKADLKKFCE